MGNDPGRHLLVVTSSDQELDVRRTSSSSTASSSATETAASASDAIPKIIRLKLGKEGRKEDDRIYQQSHLYLFHN